MALDTKKVLEFFDASKTRKQIHIVGCGAIGSHVAEQLTRMGCSNIHLWDFDTVSPHNITNQIYNVNDVGKPKVEALEEHLKLQNPTIKIIKMPQRSIIIPILVFFKR